MTEPIDNLQTRAEAAVRDGGEHVIAPNRGSVLDLVDGPTLVAWVLVFVAGSLVALNEARNPPWLDPLGIALRMLVVTATIRALLTSARFAARVRSSRRAANTTLVMLPDALVLLGAGPRSIPREALLAVHGGTGPDGTPELLAAVRAPDLPGVLSLAMPSGNEPGVVGKRIARYVAETGPTSTPAADASPTRTPAAEFDRIVRGDARPGEVAIPTSRRFLERGPYAALAFAVVLVERLARLETRLDLPYEIYALGAACIVLPIGWLAFALRRHASFGGAAMVLTPVELLVRGAHGMHRLPFSDLHDATVIRKRSFTLVTGASVEETLLVERTDGERLTFDGRLLGLSADGVAAMLLAYGDAASTPASHGSGGGTGISATTGTTASAT